MMKSIIIALVIALSPVGAVGPVSAESGLKAGSVFKGKGHSTLYYLTEDGSRLVFPNEETFRSWYDGFDEVVEINDEDLATYPLRGNVRYKPGALLVKIQSDSKVYAVSANGTLRWVKTEALAKKLYGDHWNKLIDDVPVAFFVNYNVGDPIESDEEFDAQDEEEEATTIDEDRRAKVKKKIRKKLAKKKDRLCEHFKKRLNRLQDRLEKRGIDVDGIGDDFVDFCIDANDDMPDSDSSNDDDSPNSGKNIKICHIPPGNPDEAKTLSVGRRSAKAHLAHGDTIGECERDSGNGDDSDDSTDDSDSSDDPKDDEDTTAPVISDISVSTNSTSTIVSWVTDEESDSEIEYATENLDTATSTVELSDDTLVTSHSLELTDLLPLTQYYFVIESRDAEGNKAESDEQMFTTTE